MPSLRCSKDDDAFVNMPKPIKENPNIVLIGGTGRVGSSTASALLKTLPEANLLLASRRQDSWETLKQRRPELKDKCRFRSVDIDRPQTILEVLKDADLVIHTAGPFQRKDTCSVLEAAIATGTPYMDVCDDTALSRLAKTYSERARDAGVPAITTAGIYPGVSNVMAAHMISLARKEYDSTGQAYVDASQKNSSEPMRVLYSYFTAGTGGAGPTILKTSLLLAGEEVIAYK